MLADEVPLPGGDALVALKAARLLGDPPVAELATVGAWAWWPRRAASWERSSTRCASPPSTWGSRIEIHQPWYRENSGRVFNLSSARWRCPTSTTHSAASNSSAPRVLRGREPRRLLLRRRGALHRTPARLQDRRDPGDLAQRRRNPRRRLQGLPRVSRPRAHPRPHPRRAVPVERRRGSHHKDTKDTKARVVERPGDLSRPLCSLCPLW